MRTAVAALGLGVSLFAACTPTNRSTPVPAASATPAISAVAPSGSPAPSGSTQADAAQAAIDAFIDRVTANSFGYTASLRGRASSAGGILPVTGKLTVSGANYALSVTFRFPHQNLSIRVEQRYVRQVAWERCTPCPSPSWKRVASFGSDDVLSPFAQVFAPSDVTYIGQSGTASAPRYRIRFDSMVVHPALIPAYNLSDLHVERARMTLTIDPQGRPVSSRKC